MQYFDEAYNLLQHLKEDVDYRATYYDKNTGKLYGIKNGIFQVIDQIGSGKGGGSDQQDQNNPNDQQNQGGQSGQQDQNDQQDQNGQQGGEKGQRGQKNQNGKSDNGDQQDQGDQDGQDGQDGQQGQDGQDGKNGKKRKDFDGPTIGKKGDPDIQEIENLLREIQDMKNKIGTIEDEDYIDDDSSINDISEEILNSTADLKKKIDELKKELQDLKDKLKKLGGDPGDDKGSIEKKEIEIQRKVNKIREIFGSVEVANDIMRETDRKVSQSRKEKRRGEKEAKDKEKLANMSDSEVISLLKHSLNQTLKSEINEVEEQSWSKINKKAYGAGILKKGTRISEKIDIPSINVYFDRSASWGPEESNFGYQVVESIMYLQKKGLLKIRLYYFNTQIMDSDPGYGSGGTRGTPILEHITQTKPDNVLIMTDSDITDCRQTAVVPGAVWLLFKGSISENLREHIKGKRLGGKPKTFFVK